MIHGPEGAPARPWLSDFERHDYRLIWRGKGLEDAAEKHIILSWLPPGGRCLELGAGFGRITQILKPRFNEVVSLDLSGRNLGIAKQRVAGVEWGRSDVASIPFRDSAFDCIVMVRVVHLLPDPVAVMKEACRVAREGGSVIISVPNLAMNSLLWRISRDPRMFGPAEWPFGERPYLDVSRGIIPEGFRLLKKRGTGLFDNPVGRLCQGMKRLYLLDVATSFLWIFKLDVFLKNEVRKSALDLL